MTLELETDSAIVSTCGCGSSLDVGDGSAVHLYRFQPAHRSVVVLLVDLLILIPQVADPKIQRYHGLDCPNIKMEVNQLPGRWDDKSNGCAVFQHPRIYSLHQMPLMSLKFCQNRLQIV